MTKKTIHRLHSPAEPQPKRTIHEPTRNDTKASLRDWVRDNLCDFVDRNVPSKLSSNNKKFRHCLADYTDNKHLLNQCNRRNLWMILMTSINFSRLIMLSLWLGAAVFFSVAVAPAAFGVLRSFALPNASEMAGSIVTRTLSIINVSGFVVGVFLLLTFFVRRSPPGRFSFIAELVCLSVVVLATGIGHW